MDVIQSLAIIKVNLILTNQMDKTRTGDQIRRKVASKINPAEVPMDKTRTGGQTRKEAAIIRASPVEIRGQGITTNLSKIHES